MIKDNEELYGQTRKLISEMQSMNQKDCADMLSLSLRASLMPSEVMGEIRNAAEKIIKHDFVNRNEIVKSRLIQIIEYINHAFNQ